MRIFGFWRKSGIAPYYSHTGRPSIDPEVMIRMLILGYVFAIRSERRLCEEVQVSSMQGGTRSSANYRCLLLSPRQLRRSDQLIQRQRQRHLLCDQPLQDIGRQIAQPHHPADKPI